MDQSFKCMFDTVIFNRIVENCLPVERLPKCLDLYVTHVQQDELNGTGDPEKKARLNRVFGDLGPEMISTESAVWGVSKWGQAKWTADDNLWKPIRDALDLKKRKRNNIQDALIAETAIRRGFTLVTEDTNLVEVTNSYGGQCISFQDMMNLY